MEAERVLSAAEIDAALAAHGFGGERAAAGAVVLAVDEPLRVVWANRSATTMFGTADAAALCDQVFAGRGRDGLGAAVRRLTPDGGARSERLRLFRGFRTRTLTVSISRMTRQDGGDLFVLAIPVADTMADAAFAVSALRESAGEAEPAAPVAMAEPPASDDAIGDEDGPAEPATSGAKRFVWHTDAEHRILVQAEAPAALAGIGEASWTGRHLPEAVAELGIAEAAALSERLGTERPWGGLRLLWPLADGSGTVPVALGAVPIRGEAGRFFGFRGFGVADFSATVARPIEEPLAPDRQDTPAAVVSEVAPPRAAEPGPPEPARTAFSSAKVVALRPFQVVSGGSPGTADPAPPPSRRRDDSAPVAAPGPPATPEAGGEPSNLSRAEHSNFHEIGRTLKGELGEGDALGPPGDAIALLGALPLALLAFGEEGSVFGTPAFLALSGYASIAALDAKGGVTHLLGGLDPAMVADGEAARTFPIVDADGAVLLVQGRLIDLPWSEGARVQALMLLPQNDSVAQAEGLERELKRRTADAADARLLLDRVTDVVAIVDGQGRLQMVSKAAEALFGLHETALVGESIGTLLYPDAQSAALGAVLAASTGGPEAEPAAVAVMGRRLNGRAVPLTMTARALGPGKVGLVFRDTGEVDSLRRETLRLKAELDRGSEVRADFLDRVNHEIRTPLNAILGFAEIILDERFGPIGNARYKDYLADIHAAGRRVIDYVSDLLDLSKMQAGRADLTVASVDVNRVVGEAVGEMQGQAHRGRVIVRLSLMPHLPPALVDDKALRQILSNVLTNAITYNEPGGQVIVSTARTEAGAIAVRIRDTGVGMSDTELATVLEPVRQISLGRPGNGSGLGLPLTHALAEANQATMSIQSRKDEGTLVEIGLRPAAQGERSNPAA